MNGFWIAFLTACTNGGTLVPAGSTNVSNTNVPPSMSSSLTEDQACDDRPGESFCIDDLAVQCDGDGNVLESTLCNSTTETCSQGICISCSPQVHVTFAPDSSQTIFLEIEEMGGSFHESSLHMRRFDVTGAKGSALEVDGGAVTFYHEDGTEASLPLSLTEPTTSLFALGTQHGSSTLFGYGPSACQSEPTETRWQVGSPRGLAGRPLIGHPHFEYVNTFNMNDTLHTALDPTRYPDRVGAPFDVYVVAHRNRAEWLNDPELVHLGDGPVTGQVAGGSLADNVIEAWEGELPYNEETLTLGLDIIYDFGQDGTLDPGDLIDGLDGPGMWTAQPLTTQGPHDTFSFDYSVSFDETMLVYAPDNLDELPLAPLVVISHGNGHDYRWYDYLGEHLASWGYVVMSHYNDTMPGTVTAAYTTRLNTETFIRDLTPKGAGVLGGEVDTHAIVWIGHSRGGEGVVLAYDDLVEGDASSDEYSWEDIQIVSSIAPVIFEGPDEANPHGVTYHLLAGSADGDVTGGTNSSSVQYFRIFTNHTGDGLVNYVQGATHNDFNCCGSADGAWVTGSGPRVGAAAAQNAAKSYYLALLEWKLRGNTELAEFFTRMPAGFRPLGVDMVLSNQWMPGQETPGRRVIDDFQSAPALDESSSFGSVTYTVSNAYEGDLDDAGSNLGWVDTDPMNGMTWASSDGPEADKGLVFDFDGPADLEFAWPVDVWDISRGGWLSFRTCQGTRHPNTEALDGFLNYAVVLVDQEGHESRIDFGAYGRVPDPYERTGLGDGSGWSNEFTTVQIPLLAFTTDSPEFDLEYVRKLRFEFGEEEASPIGRVGIDDIQVILEEGT